MAFDWKQFLKVFGYKPKEEEKPIGYGRLLTANTPADQVHQTHAVTWQVMRSTMSAINSNESWNKTATPVREFANKMSAATCVEDVLRLALLMVETFDEILFIEHWQEADSIRSINGRCLYYHIKPEAFFIFVDTGPYSRDLRSLCNVLDSELSPELRVNMTKDLMVALESAARAHALNQALDSVKITPDTPTDTVLAVLNRNIETAFDGREMIKVPRGKSVDVVAQLPTIGEEDCQYWIRSSGDGYYWKNGAYIQFNSGNPTGKVDTDALYEALKHGDEGKPKTKKLVLLGWRLDWPPGSSVGLHRWCGADDWMTKERLTALGSKATELYGAPTQAPSSGPTPWPEIQVIDEQEEEIHEQAE